MAHLIACCLALVASFQTRPAQAARRPERSPHDCAEVRRLVDSFEKASKDPDKDKEAVGLLDNLVEKFQESAVRDRGRIMKVMVASAKLFDTPKDKTKPRNLPVATCEQMGKLGAEALKPIQELMLDRKVWVEGRA